MTVHKRHFRSNCFTQKSYQAIVWSFSFTTYNKSAVELHDNSSFSEYGNMDVVYFNWFAMYLSFYSNRFSDGIISDCWESLFELKTFFLILILQFTHSTNEIFIITVTWIFFIPAPRGISYLFLMPVALAGRQRWLVEAGWRLTPVSTAHTSISRCLELLRLACECFEEDVVIRPFKM